MNFGLRVQKGGKFGRKSEDEIVTSEEFINLYVAETVEFTIVLPTGQVGVNKRISHNQPRYAAFRGWFSSDRYEDQGLVTSLGNFETTGTKATYDVCCWASIKEKSIIVNIQTDAIASASDVTATGTIQLLNVGHPL